MQNARDRGCEDQARLFAEAMERDSHAVINRSYAETLRLASDGNELYANYYQLIEAEVRLPKGDDWDRWRRPAEEAILPGYKEQIKFAVLSLNSLGLPHYGTCSWVCETSRIESRATVFEMNCVVFMWPFSFKESAHLPPGHRAPWPMRAKLAVAKLIAKLDSTTSTDQFPEILMAPGKRPEDDEFIEVHIYGPLSVYSLAEVVLRKSEPISKAKLGALKSKLAKLGIPLKVV